LDRVLLSTDDPEIAAAGRDLGLETPFLRPGDIADDQSPMLVVMQHTLSHLQAEGTQVEAIVLLQPTSPLRTARHIQEAVARYRAAGAATLVSVVRVPHRFTPASLMREVEGELRPYSSGALAPLRRQEKEIVFARNGPAILIVRPDVLLSNRMYGEPIVGYEMDERSSVDVDDLADLELAELLIGTNAIC
jgi:CMP-N-acetylneuraminic acid synthetase